MFPNYFVCLFSGANDEILKAWTKLKHPCPPDPQNDFDLEVTLAFVKMKLFFYKIQLSNFRAEVS